MPLRESEAVILRSYPLGEGDRLVSFLSRSWGRMRGVARGARRPKSRFGSTLEMLSHVRIWFYERETRDLVRISQCELVESFLDLQSDYGRGLALALFSEVSEFVLPEREASDGAFRLLLHAAQGLKGGCEPGLAIGYFSLWTVRLAGWLPELDRCARCGREFGGEAAYGGPHHAGLVCKLCRVPGVKAISSRSLGLARQMLGQKLGQVMEARPAVSAPQDLTGYLLDLIEHQIERKLHSRRMLEENAASAVEGSGP